MKVHYLVHSSIPPPFLYQINKVHSLTSYLLSIYFNILSSVSRYPNSPSAFPIEVMHVLFFSPVHAQPPWLSILIMLDEEYILWSLFHFRPMQKREVSDLDWLIFWWDYRPSVDEYSCQISLFYGCTDFLKLKRTHFLGTSCFRKRGAHSSLVKAQS
jgi:hypothetical protein